MWSPEQIHRDRKQQWWPGAGEGVFTGDRVSVWEDEKVLDIMGVSRTL